MQQASSKALPYSLIHFPTCESTHTWALHNLPLLVSKHGLNPTRPVRISTNFQTKGIGQPLRHPTTTVSTSSSDSNSEYKTWLSSEGNVSVTYVFPWPQKKIDGITQLPLVASVAVVNTLKQLNLNPSVKWVNDIIVNRKKIAGILCNATGYSLHSEELITDESFTAVLISIGLNVLSIPNLDQLDKHEHQSITCIANELGMNHPSSSSSASSGDNESSSSVLLLSSSSSPVSKSSISSSSSSPSCQSIITPESVLDSLSHELYSMMALYESRGFNPFHLKLTPILMGLNQIVTVKAPSINATTSIKKTSQSSNMNKPDEVRGEFIGLSSTSGCLMLRTLNSENDDNDGGRDVVEILNGRLVVS